MPLVPVVFLTVIITLWILNTFLLGRRVARLTRKNAALTARLLRMGLGGGDDETSPADVAARMMATLIDVTGPVADAANGARRQRESEGWSSHAAEQMSMMLYMMGMAKVAGPALAARFSDGEPGSGDGDGDGNDG
jgi:hypothetical protein